MSKDDQALTSADGSIPAYLSSPITHRTIEHVPCTACGCVCDDLTVTFAGDRCVGITPPCPIAVDWFETQSVTNRAVAEIDGSIVSLRQAIERTAAILKSAHSPLIYGLSRSNTEGQRSAVRLAEVVGATIDTTASQCHGPSIMAIQEVGEVTCTLGEIRNRADLVIYWGCNPAETHPRHAERYAVFPTGRRLPGGRKDRIVVMIGAEGEVESWRLDRLGSTPDIVIPITPRADFEVLTFLLSQLKPASQFPGLGSKSLSPTVCAGAAPGSRRSNLIGSNCQTECTIAKHTTDKLKDLVSRMKSCQCGVVFFGLGLTGMERDRDSGNSMPGLHTVHLLLKLVAELNSYTRFFARRMRLYGDVTGADNVLCWQTGYPFSVNLARGNPRYNPGEFSADDLLARGDVDACLLVGSETCNLLSPQSLETLRHIPTIALDNPGTSLPFHPTVRITTSVCGLSTGGTVYRMDGVPISLRTVVPATYPDDVSVLDQIRSLVED